MRVEWVDQIRSGLPVPALLLMQRAMRLLSSLGSGLDQMCQSVTDRTVVSVQRAVDRMVRGSRLLLY
jgi:hypothetical protein